MVRGIGWTGLNLERNIANSAAAGVLDVEFERRVEMAPEFEIHRHGRIEFRVDKATVEQDAHNRGPGHHAGEQKHAHVWPVAPDPLSQLANPVHCDASRDGLELSVSVRGK